MNQTNYNYNEAFHFVTEFMDDDSYINLRIEQSGLQTVTQKKAYGNLLRFLYITSYDSKINRSTLRNYSDYFTEAEKILLFRLQTHCTGSERFNYGINAILAIKRDQYNCTICKEKDVRCLEIDHVKGRTHKKGDKNQRYEINDFQTLCSNHHRIKTVIEKQQN